MGTQERRKVSDTRHSGAVQCAAFCMDVSGQTVPCRRKRRASAPISERKPLNSQFLHRIGEFCYLVLRAVHSPQTADIYRYAVLFCGRLIDGRAAAVAKPTDRRYDDLRRCPLFLYGSFYCSGACKRNNCLQCLSAGGVLRVYGNAVFHVAGLHPQSEKNGPYQPGGVVIWASGRRNGKFCTWRGKCSAAQLGLCGKEWVLFRVQGREETKTPQLF